MLQMHEYQCENSFMFKISRKKGDILKRWYYFC